MWSSRLRIVIGAWSKSRSEIFSRLIHKEIFYIVSLKSSVWWNYYSALKSAVDRNNLHHLLASNYWKSGFATCTALVKIHFVSRAFLLLSFRRSIYSDVSANYHQNRNIKVIMYELGDVIEFSYNHGKQPRPANSIKQRNSRLNLCSSANTCLEPENNHHGLIIGIVTGENGKSLGSYLVSGHFEIIYSNLGFKCYWHDHISGWGMRW
jgi:hypothetical protein